MCNAIVDAICGQEEGGDCLRSTVCRLHGLVSSNVACLSGTVAEDMESQNFAFKTSRAFLGIVKAQHLHLDRYRAMYLKKIASHLVP